MQLRIDNHHLRESLEQFVRTVSEAGGKALLVGGCVRDALTGSAIKDIDVEVYGLAPGRLREVTESQFPVDLVGEAFGVLKFKALPIEVSLPRRETRKGQGQRGFMITADPDMDPREAAARRDFTCNALAYDLLTDELLDFFGGVADLQGHVLRHVSGHFDEDPLRVLRGMQLAARLDATLAPETVERCRMLRMDEIAPERVFEEWHKLILLGLRPSKGLAVLETTGWLAFFPELAALVGCQQDPQWHPEGDVFVHTGHVLDFFAAERAGDPWEDLVVGFACLCHDLGKPLTTEFSDGQWRSHSHDEAGFAPTVTFLERLRAPKALVDEVVPLVAEHLAPALLHQGGAGSNAVRRLANRVGRLDRLVRVARADHGGRPPKRWDGFPAGQWLLETAAQLNVADSRPVALVMGRHLIDHLHLEPSPRFGQVLSACFEAQLDGRITTLQEGMELARKLVAEMAV